MIFFVIISLTIFSCGKKPSTTSLHSSSQQVWIDSDQDGLSDVEELYLGTDPFKANEVLPTPPETIDLALNLPHSTFWGTTQRDFHFDQLKVKRLWRDQIRDLLDDPNKKIALSLEPIYYISLKEQAHHDELFENIKISLQRDKKDFNLTSSLNSAWTLVDIKGSQKLADNFKFNGILTLKDVAFNKKYWEDLMQKNYRLIISHEDKEEILFLPPHIKPEEFAKNESIILKENSLIKPGETIIIVNDIKDHRSWYLKEVSVKSTSLINGSKSIVSHTSNFSQLVAFNFKNPSKNILKTNVHRAYTSLSPSVKECQFDELVFDKTQTFPSALHDLDWKKMILIDEQNLTQLPNKWTLIDDTLSKNGRTIRLWLHSFHKKSEIKVMPFSNPNIQMGIVVPNSCNKRNRTPQTIKEWKRFDLTVKSYASHFKFDERPHHPTEQKPLVSY